jgi:hypothetical protein
VRRALAGILIALATATPASANSIVVTVGLVPGKLFVASASTSLAAGTSAAIPVKVADGRGSGAGWTLRFKDATGLTVTSITARCASNSTCTLPAASGVPSGRTVLHAAKGSGMGIIALVVTVRASADATAAFAVS